MSFPKKAILAAAGVTALAIPIAIAQTPRPSFEVASVKPAASNLSIDQLGPLSGPISPFSGLTCPALSTALQDVGLQCELTKAPVEVLVIDHVEKPSEN